MHFDPAYPNDDAGFTLYFLAYNRSTGDEEKRANREGMSCALHPHNGMAVTCCDRCSGTYA
jgi:hypothetical protein